MTFLEDKAKSVKLDCRERMAKLATMRVNLGKIVEIESSIEKTIEPLFPQIDQQAMVRARQGDYARYAALYSDNNFAHQARSQRAPGANVVARA